jgi:hypothetical protein
LLAEVVLTPSEVKRLIAKAIGHMEIVKLAKENGTVIIATSTTNAYVLEELLGKEIKEKGMFTAGVVTKDGLQITEAKGRGDHTVIQKGKVKTVKVPELPDILKEMGPGDVFIKGANAIDPFGQAGILLGGIGGGTIGAAWGYLTSNGITTIIAAGLEKLVPINLTDAVNRMGIMKIDTALDVKCGIMVIGGYIITEMEAFKELFGVDVVPIGGGGIDGAEGAKIFLLDGEDEAVKEAVEMVKVIRGEPKLTTRTIKQK